MSSDDLAPVHVLHPVVEAELVDDRTQELLKSERGRAVLRREGYWADTVAVGRATQRVVTHHRTVAGARAVGRNVWYVPQGGRVVCRWLWDNWTTAGYARDIHQAELRQDFEATERLRAAAESARQARHGRILAYIRAPQELAKTLAALALTSLVVLFGLGIAAAVIFQDASLVTGPLRAILWAAAWVAWAFTVGGTLILVGAMVLLAFGLWVAGRRAGDVPEIFAPPVAAAEREEGEREVTAEGVATALAHLGIPALNKAIKDGWRVEFLLPPTLVNGRGYQMVHSIPLGTTPAMFADKRDLYARNLMRAPLEVWPTAYDKRSGFLETWVAHPGATERDGSPYPLMHEGTVDVFKNVPMGESQRGDLIAPPLMEAGMCVGGRPGQGKSNAVRVIMAGAALDPLAELRVYVFAGNGDFDAYEPRLSRYERGSDESVVVAGVNELRDLYREVERRETRLAELGAKKLSRGISSKHPDMRPIVVAFSECHEMFSHKELGEEAGDLAVAVEKRKRKTGIFTIYDTQSSRAAAIPSALVELFKYNACFSVKSWRSNDGFLGDGSFQDGIRATELRPTRDRGTSLVTGVTDESFEIMDWFYLEADDDTGFDAAAGVIDRAMKKATVIPRPIDQGDPRDLLQDVHEVLGEDDKQRASQVARRLRDLHVSYKSLNGVRLAELLGEHQVEVRELDGELTIRAHLVLRALDRREGVEW